VLPETWDEWSGVPDFIEDLLRMLDNVLTRFIEEAPDSMARAKYSALRERSVGLGVMGFHSFPRAGYPARKRARQVVESAHLPQDTPRRRRGVGSAGAGARPLSRRA
jgi:hypothetical protein